MAFFKRHFVLLALMPLLFFACSPDPSPVVNSDNTFDFSVIDEIVLEPIDRNDPYVLALCNIDIAKAAAADDPTAAFIDLLKAVPTTRSKDRAELETIVKGFELARIAPNPALVPELQVSGALLRARCN